MTSRRDKIKQALDQAPTGLATRNLIAIVAVDDSPDSLGALEMLCVLSPDIRLVDGTWRTSRAGKAAAVLLALENFATATGKRIFRSASAMESLPAESLPTEEELVQIIETSGNRFEMLPNQMIKFNK